MESVTNLRNYVIEPGQETATLKSFLNYFSNQTESDIIFVSNCEIYN
jgi:hypothetical protein